jgi:NADP-dependent 3-hydroxy acid dehydrogenase YdfG
MQTSTPSTAGRPIAIVAGGGSGIGEACALRLAREGWRLILVGRTEAKLPAVAQLIASAGGAAQAFVGDVRDWDRMAELAAHVATDGLDLLINSAGGQFAAPSAERSKRARRSSGGPFAISSKIVWISSWIRRALR